MHHLNAALRAHALYRKDVEYIVQDNQVLIVDEFTGRVLAGRRWSDRTLVSLGLGAASDPLGSHGVSLTSGQTAADREELTY